MIRPDPWMTSPPNGQSRILRPVVALDDRQLAEVIRQAMGRAELNAAGKQAWTPSPPGTKAVGLNSLTSILPANRFRRAITISCSATTLWYAFGDTPFVASQGIAVSAGSNVSPITYDDIGHAITFAIQAITANAGVNIAWQEFLAAEQD